MCLVSTTFEFSLPNSRPLYLFQVIATTTRAAPLLLARATLMAVTRACAATTAVPPPARSARATASHCRVAVLAWAAIEDILSLNESDDLTFA